MGLSYFIDTRRGFYLYSQWSIDSQNRQRYQNSTVGLCCHNVGGVVALHWTRGTLLLGMALTTLFDTSFICTFSFCSAMDCV